MTQVQINLQVFPPMPVVLVGTQVAGRPNFMAQGWITRCNYEPPLLAVAINKGHYTYEGIMQTRQFSICIPGRDLLVETDYCGIVSGRDEDKADLFEVFYGNLPSAPLIADCPLNLACYVVNELEFTTNTLFIAEICEAYADNTKMDGTRPGFREIDPFILTMPDNSYWSLGEPIGKAWQDGKKLDGE